MVSDEILVKRTLNGDLGAYGELVQRYQDKIFGYAVRMLAPEDARDAAQEVFIRVFQALPRFDFRAGFDTWLYRVATNLCIDLSRRHARERSRKLPLEACGVTESLKNVRAGPEEALLQKERLENLRRAVYALPEGYKAALVLHHYQGLSYRDVAEVTGLSEKTVATRIHRAKLMLKNELLGGDGGALPEGKRTARQISGRGMPVV
ncbi:MAG: sigma-70 family RNA polymerase sigma factor [Bacillota bacterium]